MASPQPTYKKKFQVISLTWALASGDTPVGWAFPRADRSVQVKGTPSGATVTLLGSNDEGATWFALKDAATGTAISFTAAGGCQILEHSQMVKPSIAGGDGSTALEVIVSAAKKRLR